MDFLGIGSLEILLILVLALILLGPGKLTEIARTMGKTVRTIKKASSDLTATVTRELEAGENEPPVTRDKAGAASSGINKPIAPAPDDRPTRPGEAPTTK
jgi:sec-independent protein translocase protein TatB